MLGFLHSPTLTSIHDHWKNHSLDRPAAAAAKSLQSCLTLCDPTDGSPPGSPISGILQARTLEWVAISFSNAWKWKVKVKPLSRVWLLATPWTAAYQAPPMGFSRQEYWTGLPLPSPSLALLVAKWLFYCFQQCPGYNLVCSLIWLNLEHFSAIVFEAVIPLLSSLW